MRTTTPLERFTAAAYLNSTILGTYATYARYKGAAITDIQKEAARDHNLDRTEEVLIRVEFL